MTRTQGTLAALLASLAGCSPDQGNSIDLTGQPQALRVECAAASGMDDAADEWICPESVQVVCSDLDASAIVVQSPSTLMCDADVLEVTYDEPLTPGSHRISVRNADDEELCFSEAVVVRGRELALVPKHVKLWPPNHKLHEISVEDCVEVVGACPGEELDAHFIWASSDEAIDAKGSGKHDPDIVMSADCQALSLRSERQGSSDGRVYTLGVRLIDADGESYESSCTVSVDHDQSGREAVAGADAYRIDFDGSTQGIPSCEDVDNGI